MYKLKSKLQSASPHPLRTAQRAHCSRVAVQKPPSSFHAHAAFVQSARSDWFSKHPSRQSQVFDGAPPGHSLPGNASPHTTRRKHELTPGARDPEAQARSGSPRRLSGDTSTSTRSGAVVIPTQPHRHRRHQIPGDTLVENSNPGTPRLFYAGNSK